MEKRRRKKERKIKIERRNKCLKNRQKSLKESWRREYDVDCVYVCLHF